LRDDPAADAVVELNGGAFGGRLRPKREFVVLLEEFMMAASGSKTIALACRTLPKETKSTEIAVCAWLKPKNLDLMHCRPMAAFGDDFVDGTTSGAPQFI
jgi:hypothetical protein